MAVGKEIRGKIKSVENTKKITKAMEMVAASKMRKAQERMRSARPYSDRVRNIAANLGKANPEYTHPFMKLNDAKAAGFIVITGLLLVLWGRSMLASVSLTPDTALKGLKENIQWKTKN